MKRTTVSIPPAPRLPLFASGKPRLAEQVEEALVGRHMPKGMPVMSDTARVFMHGRSQAVRLPAAYRFKGKEVLIERRGGAVILREKTESLGDAVRGFFATAEPVPADYLKSRRDELPQSRKLFQANRD